MKYFKKAAVLLAAALFLSLLTACSGGNLTSQNFGGCCSAYFECISFQVNGENRTDPDTVSFYYTADLNRAYISYESESSASLLIYSGEEKGCYDINIASHKIYRSDNVEHHSILPISGDATKYSTREYNNKTYQVESFFTHCIDNEGNSLDTSNYYYENGHPTYLIREIMYSLNGDIQTQSYIYQIKNFSRSANTAMLDLAPYRDYTWVSSPDDLVF